MSPAGLLTVNMRVLTRLRFCHQWSGCGLTASLAARGVGLMNMLLFLITRNVHRRSDGRTNPRISGQKIGGREMKLAMIALLVHPIMILFPTGYFAGSDWGTKAENNPGAHGFSEIMYQFSSSSANNGSALDGLGTTGGTISNPTPSPTFVPWDIATALVMIFSRYLPIVAAIAMAASLGAKKTSPFSLGDFARRHSDVRLSATGHSCNHWGPSVSARSRAWTIGRTFRSHPVRWLNRSGRYRSMETRQ